MSTMPTNRASDKGAFCWLAQRCSEAWDWFDKRQIDRHIVTVIVLIGTIKITAWATHFVDAHPDKPGLDVAAIISAVMVPWSALQAAAIKFFFDARA